MLAASPLIQAANLSQLKSSLQNQQYGQALQQARQLQQLQPDNPEALFLLALSHQYNGNDRQAMLHYARLIELRPDWPQPRNNLALLHLKQGEHEEAIAQLTGALQAHEDYAAIWSNLSSIYQTLASQAYQQALNESSPAQVTFATGSMQVLAQLAAPQTNPTSASTQSVKATDTEEDWNPVIRAEQLIAKLESWSQHWSEKRFEQYVQAYIPDYQGEQKSHQEWVDFRRARIIRPDKISISLSDFKVRSISQKQAIIDFTQSYRSASYQDRVIKRITLVPIESDWKISRERTLSVL